VRNEHGCIGVQAGVDRGVAFGRAERGLFELLSVGGNECGNRAGCGGGDGGHAPESLLFLDHADGVAGDGRLPVQGGDREVTDELRLAPGVVDGVDLRGVADSPGTFLLFESHDVHDGGEVGEFTGDGADTLSGVLGEVLGQGRELGGRLEGSISEQVGEFVSEAGSVAGGVVELLNVVGDNVHQKMSRVLSVDELVRADSVSPLIFLEQSGGK